MFNLHYPASAAGSADQGKQDVLTILTQKHDDKVQIKKVKVGK